MTARQQRLIDNQLWQLIEPSAARPGERTEDDLAALRARVAALETEKDELVAEQARLVTDRDILHQAAK